MMKIVCLLFPDPAAGAGRVFERFLEGRRIREERLAFDASQLAGAGAHSYAAT